MRKDILLSNLGFALGLIGVVIAVIPFFNLSNFGVYNSLLPVIFGVVGLILVLKIKKELYDDVVKGGFVINPLAILFGIIWAINCFIK